MIQGLRDLNVRYEGIVEWSRKASAIVGDSPVDEILTYSRGIPSTTGHEKPCGNPGGPSSKTKYICPTDSELVP